MSPDACTGSFLNEEDSCGQGFQQGRQNMRHILFLDNPPDAPTRLSGLPSEGRISYQKGSNKSTGPSHPKRVGLFHLMSENARTGHDPAQGIALNRINIIVIALFLRCEIKMFQHLEELPGFPQRRLLLSDAFSCKICPR